MINIQDLSKIKGEILQEDIDHGVRCDHEQCALARAIERMLPGYTIFIDDYVQVNDKNDEIATELAMSTALQRWVDAFDNDELVRPIPLSIHRSTGGVNRWILCMGKADYEKYEK